MTANKCLKMIEAYYGKYERVLVRETIFDYLQQFQQAELEILYHRLTHEYSGQFKYPPDVAILEDIKRKINEEERDKIDGHPIGTNRRHPARIMLPECISEEEKQSAGNILRKSLEEWGIPDVNGSYPKYRIPFPGPILHRRNERRTG